ncbi:MAG: UDP-N-acetylglucosamine--N-acetylmuramyl-(pentapeptide) pyrophosphoryl-undecaprenol N-acetylglucosamine transferase [Planctomycetota bacterium]|nr:UDP-N-acetylglucosamine--N-acetylmuramyl-(pentapeptide) pyrophosphoryl-undecaprenol N-acetylglucosamine transferase [Planctomycetota bacterium]
MTSRTFLFAGGGSGGHISPGLAIAERLIDREPGSRVLFACSTRPIDARMLAEAGVEHVALPAMPLSLRPAGLARFLRSLRRSRVMCREALARHHVDHVIALGGFVSAPAVLAARSQGVSATLLNLDRPPGKANRWLARRCDRIWTAIELPTLPRFARRVVGMPIRRRALAPGDRRACRARLSLDPDRPVLLVTGASQGAASINRFMRAMAESRADVFAGWQVLHLAGDADVESIRREYEQRGIPGRVEPFLDEMGLAWGSADLAVSRAGASSVAEVAANAVPTLFLPYPYHRDMHQVHNARPLAETGGAMIVEDRIEARANIADAGRALTALLADETSRSTMRARLLERRPPDAAATIADLLLEEERGDSRRTPRPG